MMDIGNDSNDFLNLQVFVDCSNERLIVGRHLERGKLESRCLKESKSHRQASAISGELTKVWVVNHVRAGVRSGHVKLHVVSVLHVVDSCRSTRGVLVVDE